MRKILIFFALNLLLSLTGLACKCTELNKEIIDELKSYSDFIFIGTVLNGDNWNPYSVERMNQSKSASDIYMRVDSVLVGNVQAGDIIFIYQSAGSCTESFTYGEQQIIFGKQIKRIKKIQDKPSTHDGDLPPTTMPPPLLGLQEDGTYETNADELVIDFLNEKLKDNVVVDTDMCRSFRTGSQIGSDVIQLLNK